MAHDITIDLDDVEIGPGERVRTTVNVRRADGTVVSTSRRGAAQVVRDGDELSLGILASAHVAPAGGGGGSYSDEVLADSPLVYWRLDDASGTTATDSSTNSRSGAYGGTYTLDAGSVGVSGGSSVDVNNGDAALGSAAWMDPGNAFSVKARVNADYLTGTDNLRVIASRYDFADAGAYHWHLSIYGSKAYFRVHLGGGTFRNATGSTTLSTGTDYEVVGTWDGSTVRVYVDGSLDGSSATSAATVSAGGAALRVGRFSSNAAGTITYSWDGRLAEFAYFGTALSSTRIAAHYNAA